MLPCPSALSSKLCPRPKGRLFDLLDLMKAWLQLLSINLTEFVSFVEMIDPRGPNSSDQRYCRELQDIDDFDSGGHEEEGEVHGEEP